MNDIGKELYERVRADFERRLAADKRPPKDMRGVSDYSARVGRYLAEAIAANVTEDALPGGRLYYNIAESILEPSLRTNYELVNDTAAEVQRLLDERQGLRIKPARADYPEERVQTVIGAASEEGIEFDRALRRMTSPAENITQSFADDFMQANAAQRSRAGFDTFIERQGGLNCCPWCAGLVGVFAYPKGLPKEVFARHDNCTCSVTYGTKGGARQHVWSKQTWSSEQEREYLRLTDEAKRGNGGKRLTPKQIAAIREKVQAPHRLTKEQAAALGAFAQPRRLTAPAIGDGSKFYRKVELGSEKVQTTRGTGGSILINASPVLNSKNKLYVSESISPKPRLVHQVDNALTEVLQAMGITNAENLPDVYIISNSEMAKNAVAAYRASDNKLFVNSDFAYYTRDKAPEIMQEFVNPKDYRSTYFHEMYHWADAQEYRVKVGAISKETYQDYERYVQEKAKKALDKLVESGYNIFEISEYASDAYDEGLYDETFAEYRTAKALKR